MRRITIAILFVLIAGASHAQNKYVDSLKTVLANTTKPIDRFNLLNKIAEDIFTNGDGNIDSSSCLQMLRIAQQLNSDSLLAVGYNMAEKYFFFYNCEYRKGLEEFFL